LEFLHSRIPVSSSLLVPIGVALARDLLDDLGGGGILADEGNDLTHRNGRGGSPLPRFSTERDDKATVPWPAAEIGQGTKKVGTKKVSGRKRCQEPF
jgi:hypothetical protein